VYTPPNNVFYDLYGDQTTARMTTAEATIAYATTAQMTTAH
jgi:hypothetical protein